METNDPLSTLGKDVAARVRKVVDSYERNFWLKEHRVFLNINSGEGYKNYNSRSISGGWFLSIEYDTDGTTWLHASANYWAKADVHVHILPDGKILWMVENEPLLSQIYSVLGEIAEAQANGN